MKRFFKIFSRFFLGFLFNAIYIVACVFPKNKKIWIFSAWNGKFFSDNPKFIYLYTYKNHKDISVIWITKSRTLYNQLRDKGLPVSYAYSLKGYYYQLIAGAAIFSHSLDWEFLSYFIGYKTKKIQAWHSVPIKKIGLDDKNYQKRFVKRLVTDFIMPYAKDFKYDLVFACSEFDKSIYCSAFNTQYQKVRITGYPRNDSLFSPGNLGSFPDKKELNIIYMPTFRGDVGSEFNLLKSTGFDFEKINSLMKSLNSVFYIKVHPVQVFSSSDINSVKNMSNIKFFDNNFDIYEKLADFNILITDFSGIFFDFLITGRPIIMAPLEMDDYILNNRDLYFKYKDICPDLPCGNWDEIFYSVENIIRNNNFTTERYIKLQKKFHTYFDGNSSKRAYKEIKALF